MLRENIKRSALRRFLPECDNNYRIAYFRASSNMVFCLSFREKSIRHIAYFVLWKTALGLLMRYYVIHFCATWGLSILELDCWKFRLLPSSWIISHWLLLICCSYLFTCFLFFSSKTFAVDNLMFRASLSSSGMKSRSWSFKLSMWCGIVCLDKYLIH